MERVKPSLAQPPECWEPSGAAQRWVPQHLSGISFSLRANASSYYVSSAFSFFTDYLVIFTVEINSKESIPKIASLLCLIHTVYKIIMVTVLFSF